MKVKIRWLLNYLSLIAPKSAYTYIVDTSSIAICELNLQTIAHIACIYIYIRNTVENLTIELVIVHYIYIFTYCSILVDYIFNLSV